MKTLKHYRHRYKYRWGALLTVVLLIGFSMAQNISTAANDDMRNMASLMQNIITFFSRWRIVLSLIAGKLMSNAWVFGEVIHMDIYLRQLRKVTQTFANFWLGFLLLFLILKGILSNEFKDGISQLAKKIGYFIVAGVLIQASWFLFSAIIDIEIITTSAAGTLPGIVIQKDSSRWQHIYQSIAAQNILGQEYILTESNNFADKPLEIRFEDIPNYNNTNQNQLEEVLDGILPSYQNLAWPLLYIGTSIIGFQEYTAQDPNIYVDRKTMIVSYGIKFFVTIAYALAMLILVVANMIRIIYLRLAIALAPIWILLRLVQKAEIANINMDEIFGNGRFSFTRENCLKLIFYPTIITGLMGIILIAIVGVRQMLGSGWSGQISPWTYLTETWFQSDTTVFEMQGDILGWLQQDGLGLFHNIILLALSLALLYLLLSVTTQITKLESLGNLAKQITKVPFIPFTKMRNGWKWFVQKVLPGSAQFMNDGSLKLDAGQTKGTWIDSYLGQGGYIPSKQDEQFIKTLANETTMQNTTTFFSTAQNWANTSRSGLNINNNTQWQQIINTLLSKYGKSHGFKNNMDSKQNIQEFFKDQDNKINFNKLMGITDTNLQKTIDPTTYTYWKKS